MAQKPPTNPENAAAAYEALAAHAEIPLIDVTELYEATRASRRVERYEFGVDKPSISVMYLSELLLGNQYADIGFLRRAVEDITTLPENMHPDLVVFSGLLQGDFRVWEKRRRESLVPGLTTMKAQFAHGRKVIDALTETGVPLVYNLSNDDRRIAREATVETFRKMQGMARDTEGNSWSSIDRMERHPQWDRHLRFQTEHVLPYCLRLGRTLRSDQEMAEATGGAIAIDEYFVLLQAYEKFLAGEEVPPAYANWLLTQDATMNRDFVITDDLDLHLKTAGREYVDWIRHHLGFSAQPMYQDHLKVGGELLGARAASGLPTPDMLVTQHNQEAVGVSSQNAWQISTGGLLRASDLIGTRGSHADIPGDTARRLSTTRRRVPEPSATIHERTDDGRHIVTFLNDALREKSFSIPERMSIAELCDLQTGSITARPDVLAKYLDYIRTRLIGERTTAIFFGGDMIHGRNYPHFASESQSSGLMSMDSQVAFNVDLFNTALKDMTSAELAALQRVIVQVGNHEWNSGTLKGSTHGYSFADYMRAVFERKFARGQYSDEEIAERVKFHDAFVTPQGELVKDYTGLEYFGDMGVLIRHYLLERGGKGSGGSLPVYQAQSFATGAGALMKSVDILMAGHWHHPQYALLGNKLAVVGGSMAGLSGYEWSRGYRPTMAGTVLHIGGGLPPQVEFISEEALHHHTISTGDYAPGVLREAGFTDDPDFDPIRHGYFLPDGMFPKSALQKKIWQQMRGASQSAGSVTRLR